MKVSKEIAELFCHYCVGFKPNKDDDSDDFYSPHLVTLIYHCGGNECIRNRTAEECASQFGKFCRLVANELDPINPVVVRDKLLIKVFMLGCEYENSKALSPNPPNIDSTEAELYLKNRGLIS